jgi:hypothetical protein
MNIAKTTVAAGAVCAAVLAVTAACGPPATPAEPVPSQTSTTVAASPPAARPRQQPTQVPAPVVEPAPVEDASLVADRVAGLLWAVDTRTDETPADAARRSGPWLTAAALEQVTAAPAVDADWLELAAHEGWVLAVVDDVDDLVGRVQDTPRVATRTRGVRLTAIGEDGWAGPESYVVATLRLTRADPAQPWLVDDVEATWALDPSGHEYSE